jgi:hypothetical protein
VIYQNVQALLDPDQGGFNEGEQRCWNTAMSNRPC